MTRDMKMYSNRVRPGLARYSSLHNQVPSNHNRLFNAIQTLGESCTPRPRHVPQAPPSALVHRLSTTARPRHTHRIRIGSSSSCGPPTGSDSRLGSACPRVRPPSPCAWHRRALAGRARRAGGKSSGSVGRILVWPSRVFVFLSPG